MKKRRNIVIVVLIVMGVRFFATKEQRAFHSARQAYNMESYEQFLSKYPESEYSEKVYKYMYMLAKEETGGLLKFYQKYPNQPQATSVLGEVIHLAYRDAKKEQTEEGWIFFRLMLDSLDKYHIELEKNGIKTSERRRIIEIYKNMY